MQITEAQLQDIIPRNSNISEWTAALNKVLPEYEINTPGRVAAFLAQTAHESAGFTALKENLNYRATSLRKVFGKYFPNDSIAEEYANKPNKQEAIANRVYANRMGNGDEASGDGYRYCGRGLIQLTGRNNYQAFADSTGMNIDDVPDYLETPEGAVASACWFWKTNKLNRYADDNDITTLTKRINGGTIGLDERMAHYKHALEVFEA